MWEVWADLTLSCSFSACYLSSLQEEAQAQLAAGQPFTLTNRAPWADKQAELPELTEEQKAYIQEQAEKKEAAATADEVEAKGPTSFFHGKADQDYQVGHGVLKQFQTMGQEVVSIVALVLDSSCAGVLLLAGTAGRLRA